MKMLAFPFVLSLIILLSACSSKRQREQPKNDWSSRAANELPADSISVTGQTYLSVYSEIYSQTEHITHDLTATVSMRNMNERDTVFITKANYYNTEGRRIRSYFDNPIYIAPMETVEIIIQQSDNEGGSGANFTFNWVCPIGVVTPHFEAVMISTSGQQGLSFTSQGIRTK